MKSLYKQIIKSKSGEDIPLFFNDRPMHSKYSPVKEAENFGADTNPQSQFTVILGLGGGYHIEAFRKKHPTHKIVVIEESEIDIAYLSKINCVKNLQNDKSISIISKEKTADTILNKYLPAIYGGINILCHRAWYDNNKETADMLINLLNSLIKKISQDYSVQCHFGFIWQKNIISNLQILNQNNFEPLKIDSKKTAAIIAAGPSLDYTIKELIENRENYFIIATDTALSTLCKYRIKIDSVVSIDGQNISYKHFTGFVDNSTIFAFDLQSNFNAVNFAKQVSSRIIFFKSGHPFSTFAESCCSNIPFINLDCGAGTVTIAAIDFAKEIGFTDFKVFGADFSYINNKPYAKGTYLDPLYRQNENKVFPAENLFTNLLFRTEISKEKNIIKTETLNLYKETFINWIIKNDMTFSYQSHIYFIKSKNNTVSGNSIYSPHINFESLKSKLISEENSLNKLNDFQIYDEALTNQLIISLLPYISYLRTKDNSLSFSQTVKLALSKILEYT